MSRIRHTDPLYWQYVYRQAMREAAQLDALRARYKNGAVVDALWSGAYELRKVASKQVECALFAGLLLTMFVEDKS